MGQGQLFSVKQLIVIFDFLSLWTCATLIKNKNPFQKTSEDRKTSLFCMGCSAKARTNQVALGLLGLPKQERSSWL